MKIKTLSIPCFVLLFAIVSFAQATKTATDPISGNWGDPKGAGFVLKYDGKRAVAGTIRIVNQNGFSTAPIKTGTFDSKTGALKIEGEGKNPDGTTMHWVIEGTVDKSTVAGTYKFDTNQGNFKFDRVNP